MNKLFTFLTGGAIVFASVAVKAQTTKVTDYGFKISSIYQNGAFYKPGWTFPVSSEKPYVPLLGVDSGSKTNSPVCRLSLSDVDSIVIHYSSATPVSGKKLQLRPICKNSADSIVNTVYVILKTDVSTPQTFRFKFKSNASIAACDSLMNCALVNVNGITIDSAYYVMSDGKRMPVIYPESVKTLVSDYATAPVTLFVNKRYQGFQLMRGSSSTAETCAASNGITHYIIKADRSLTSDLKAFQFEADDQDHRTVFSGETSDFVYSNTDFKKFYVRHISPIPTTGAQIGWITINSIEGYKGCVSLDESQANASTLSALKSGYDYAVTINRSVTANQWTGMVLPYAMTRQQLKTIFGSDAQVATFTGATTSGDNTRLNFATTAGDIAAGTPFLLYATQDVKSLPLIYGKPTATVSPVTADGLTFTGTFDANTAVAAGTVYLATGNVMKTIQDGGGTIAGFRAYFVPNTTLPAKTYTLSVDATTTAIGNVSVSPAQQQAKIFSIDGRYMGMTTDGLQPGIYVSNGKKFIVK